MPMSIRSLRAINDGLLLINGRPWTRCKLRGRQKHCTRCYGILKSRDEAFRPVREGEGVVRYMRLCLRRIARVASRLDSGGAIMHVGDDGSGSRSDTPKAAQAPARKAPQA